MSMSAMNEVEEVDVHEAEQMANSDRSDDDSGISADSAVPTGLAAVRPYTVAVAPAARTPMRRFTSLLEEGKSDWKSLWITNAIGFMTGVQFSIFFTSVYPYLKELKDDTSQVYFGLVISIYSLLQLVLSPAFGWWSNKFKTSRWPTATGIVLMIVGDVVYAFAELAATPEGRIHMVLAGRAFMGAGSATVGVMRAYVATASVARDRSRAISLYIACMVGGIAMGPGLQIAFTPLKYPGVALGGALKLNLYTGPAYAGAVVMAICLLLLFAVFKEQYAGIVQESSKKDRFFVLPKYDRVAVAACLIVWFVMNSVSTNVEAIAVPYTMTMYSWDNETAVLNMAIMIFASAAISFTGYALLAFSRLGKLNERKVVITGLICFTIFHVITYPWPIFTGKIDYNDPKVPCLWCDSTPVVPLPVFLASYLMFISTGYPLISSPISVLYSKILGPRRQGTMQGIIVLMGSVARTIGPLAITSIFQEYGPSAAWIMEIVLQIVALAAMFMCYTRLVPLNRKVLPAPGKYISYKNGKLYRF